jgi:hypothetical protein
LVDVPRSNDGRWTVECKLCGEPFFQRKPSQEFCSQKCSNKASPGMGGRKPDASLAPRSCIVCDERFQPYRNASTCCSTACYRTTGEYAEAQRRTDGRIERMDRKNELRRTRYRDDTEYRQRKQAENRAQNLRKYGLTPEDYDRMLAEQGGVCAICGSPPDPEGVRAASRLHPDHDHATSVNRDLLCLNCNIGVGHFRDDPALLRAAAAYIERHRAAQPLPA